MQRIGIAISIIFAGAFIGYLVKAFIPTLITGTSAGENIQTYIIPFTIFVIVIVIAIRVVFSRNKPKEQ
jgi:heme/copper-type cytochrome/quinol oxidase subunit 4